MDRQAQSIVITAESPAASVSPFLPRPAFRGGSQELCSSHPPPCCSRSFCGRSLGKYELTQTQILFLALVDPPQDGCPPSLAILMFPGLGRTQEAKGACLTEGKLCLYLTFSPSLLAQGSFQYDGSYQLALLFHEGPRKQVIDKVQWRRPLGDLASPQMSPGQELYPVSIDTGPWQLTGPMCPFSALVSSAVK